MAISNLQGVQFTKLRNIPKITSLDNLSLWLIYGTRDEKTFEYHQQPMNALLSFWKDKNLEYLIIKLQIESIIFSQGSLFRFYERKETLELIGGNDEIDFGTSLKNSLRDS
jgi:hypothetical protein